MLNSKSIHTKLKPMSEHFTIKSTRICVRFVGMPQVQGDAGVEIGRMRERVLSMRKQYAK